jgi:hypothetical protein
LLPCFCPKSHLLRDYKRRQAKASATSSLVVFPLVFACPPVLLTFCRPSVPFSVPRRQRAKSVDCRFFGCARVVERAPLVLLHTSPAPVSQRQGPPAEQPNTPRFGLRSHQDSRSHRTSCRTPSTHTPRFGLRSQQSPYRNTQRPSDHTPRFGLCLQQSPD